MKGENAAFKQRMLTVLVGEYVCLTILLEENDLIIFHLVLF
jgi:hypothetical protein